jgi:aspartate racemase
VLRVHELVIPTRNPSDLAGGGCQNELVIGIKENSRQAFIGVINRLEKRGAQGVILGCTVIPMLITQKDVSKIVLDSTAIHIESIIVLSEY